MPGTLDVGITGRDLLLDSGAEAEELLTLGFAGSTFRFAGPPGGARDGRPTSPGSGWRRAIPGWSPSTWRATASRPTVVRLDGAVESSVTLGVADAIADVVETGYDAARRPAWRSSASRSCAPRRC